MMARVLKRPEDRRSELLDCAQTLFMERGYEATTINDIMASAQVSKGGFYHHFAAKEALLEALATRMADDSLRELGAILDAPNLDAVTRLNGLLAGSRRLKAESASTILAVFAAIFRPENLVLYHRLNEAVSSRMRPVLARIIDQGVAEGVFKTTDSDGTAELLLRIGAGTRDVVAKALGAQTSNDREAAARALDDRLALYSIAVDRILGLPDGTIHFGEPGFGAALFAAGRLSPRITAEATQDQDS